MAGVAGTDAAGPEDLRSALQSAGVSTATMRTLAVDGAPDTVPAIDVEPSAWFTVLQAARRVVDRTQHWPLATTLLGSSIGRGDMQGPDGLDVTPAAIIARVPAVDVDALLDAEQERQRQAWTPDEEHLRWMLSTSQDVADLGLEVDDVHAALGPRPDRLRVERWLLDAELAKSPGSAKPGDGRYLEWFTPPRDVTILLLPTTEPWAAGAFEGGYMWGYPHTDLRTAVLRRWYLRHGAEPAANWGSMLQLVVRRPPRTIEAAWVIAREVALLWPDTAGGGNGISTRTHARDLIDRDRWFLHYRP